MINVTKTYLPEKEKFLQYVNLIYNSGWLTNNGELLQRLESRLKEFLDAEYLLLTVNGTCALQLAYKLLDLKGEVITTPFTFAATSSSLVWEGLQPVFVDINSKTLNIDIDKIEEEITDKTSAILPVHVFGNVCEVEHIQRIAEKYNLKLIYDAAHAFDVKFKDQNISHFGDVSVYSFHSTKVFHTIEGGAIVVKDRQLYEKALLMRNFGIPGYDKISELGVNYKMNEFQAAMGLCVLDDYKSISLQRKKVYLRYLEFLQPHPDLEFQVFNDQISRNYSYFPVIFKTEERLLKAKEVLNKNEIYPRRYFFPSLNKLPYLSDKQVVPISESISGRILCLPLFHDLDLSVQNYIIETILKYA